MPILRRPCPRLPLRASLWMKILIESVMSSAHLFGGRPRGRADPLGSHSDAIFAHLSYFMRDTCPAHFSFLRWHELIAYGIILNLFGAALLLMKAQLDKDVIKSAVEQKFRDAGIKVNSSGGSDDDDDDIVAEPSAVLMVFITMGGRMANVVGTMKLYKGLGKYLSDRKRKKFQSTTERIQNGEAETECTELLADCCTIF
uniref:Uncharacterized protein n=2 Tax=Caenorhabditis japonica TaxID=281687 RepID=A0A8R1HPV3_CAEJA